MYDHMLASDEFTIKAWEAIQMMLLSKSEEYGHLGPRQLEAQACRQPTPQLESALTLRQEGDPPALYLFNSVALKLQTIHDNIVRDKAKRDKQELQEEAAELQRL